MRTQANQPKLRREFPRQRPLVDQVIASIDLLQIQSYKPAARKHRMPWVSPAGTWQVDLLFVDDSIILNAINVNSRFGWATTIPNKKTESILVAIEQLVNAVQPKTIIRKIQTQTRTDHNRKLTMAPFRPHHVQLLHQLHQPMEVAMAGNVGPIPAAAVTATTSESAPTVQDEAIQPASSAITEQSAHVDDSTPSSLRRPMPDCQDSRRSLPRPKKRKRNPQMCRVCGHARFMGLWGTEAFHNRSAPVGTAGFCRVPESAHIPEGARKIGWCDCAQCNLQFLLP